MNETPLELWQDAECMTLLTTIADQYGLCPAEVSARDIADYCSCAEACQED